MLGEIREEMTAEGLKIQGHIRTYALDLSFQLVPVQERRGERSPTHNIMMRGKHGKGFYAGSAWQGHSPEHGRYFSLAVEVPELFDGTQSFIAGEARGENGAFYIRRSVEKTEKQAA